MSRAPLFDHADTAKSKLVTALPVPQTQPASCTVDPGKPLIIDWGSTENIYIVLEHLKLSAQPLGTIGYDVSPRWFLT